MFHVQPAAQDNRVSFISVHDHIYSEIPDDSETSDESVHSNASSPLSEGSLSDDFLRIIACPSSNSSLSDDDLARPNVRSSSSVTTTATVHPAPKTGGMAAMTIADSWDEPPLDRNASMLPTSESTLGEDVSHPRALCADELKTATTGSGEEEAAIALAEPLYENNVTASIPPCHTSNDDYLQPIVSAPMSHNSLSDDYLHPIASVLEGARPATPARSDRPSQGRTASVRTASDVQPQAGKAVAKPQPHKNPPDDNLHPVSSALGKKTTAATVQPKQLSEGDNVVESPYENMMDM
ncbi:hypothetical protein V1264_017447 [Littorina saxatilis]|uniref:Uncharacterized protein n=2 Tax=Littorina saxatilis TaxID=31220 RepID=A0AAN9GFS5_9CAEN